MASSRIYDEAPSDVHIRAFVDRIRSSARLDGLVAKIAFLCQPQQIEASMIRRVIHSDPLFGPPLIRRLSSAAHAITGPSEDDAYDPLSVLGVEESRRILAITGLSILFAIAAPKQCDAANAILNSTYAISFFAGRLGENAKFCSSDSAAGIVCLHGLGMAVMLGAHGDLYAESVIAPDPKTSWTDWERATFGVDHAEAGALFMNRFGFSVVPQEAISRHHEPIDQIKEFPQLLALAENLAIHRGLAPGLPDLEQDRIKPWVLRFGSKIDDLDIWVESIAAGQSRLA